MNMRFNVFYQKNYNIFYILEIEIHGKTIVKPNVTLDHMYSGMIYEKNDFNDNLENIHFRF